MSAQSVGVGIISLGWMGRVHARGYRSVTERYPELGISTRLVSCADLQEAARAYATQQVGFERAVEDYREVLADPEVDVVSICSPNFLHHEIALAAIGARKPFWIEKPMGVSAHESGDIARAAAAADLVNAVGFNYRHAPAIARMRQLARSGALGRLTNVRVWFIADYASSGRGPLTWRYDRARAGSGVVGDLMSHGFDLAQFVVGRLASVTATSGVFVPERPIPTKLGVGHSGFEVGDETGPVENEDYVAVLGRFDNGVLGTFEASRVSVGPRAEYVIEVYGTTGSARWNFEHLNDLLVCTGDSADRGYTRLMAGGDYGDFARFQPGPGVSMGFDDLKTVEARLFLESVRTGRQVAPSAADAWSAALCADAAVSSATAGSWVDVEPVNGTTIDA